MTSQLSEQPAGMRLRKERLCRGEEKRWEGRKRRRRRGGKGLARENSATPTDRRRTERGWERKTDPVGGEK